MAGESRGIVVVVLGFVGIVVEVAGEPASLGVVDRREPRKLLVQIGVHTGDGSGVAPCH